MTDLDPLALARDRAIGVEAHRVLRCLEQILSFDTFEPIDAGAMARLLDVRPQAISRALRVLTERGVITRGAPIGRASTFRLLGNIEALLPAKVDSTLSQAHTGDLDRLARAGGFPAGYSLEELRKDIAAGRCWMLVSNGAVVGQLAIRKDPSVEMAYLVARLLVERQYRRRGLGRRLFEAMERSLDGNRIHVYCPLSDAGFLNFLLGVNFVLSGFVKGRNEHETRLLFSKLACAADTALPGGD